MNTPTQLQKLIAEILREYPAAQIELDPFPSGVRILDVSLNGRSFELDYSPNQSTGVSENFNDTPPFIGHDKVFDSLDEAIEHFKSFLADAAKTEVESQAFVLHDKKI